MTYDPTNGTFSGNGIQRTNPATTQTDVSGRVVNIMEDLQLLKLDEYMYLVEWGEPLEEYASELDYCGNYGLLVIPSDTWANERTHVLARIKEEKSHGHKTVETRYSSGRCSSRRCGDRHLLRLCIHDDLWSEVEHAERES